MRSGGGSGGASRSRKCVPSGGPCSAPARRSPALQVSGEGGGGRGRPEAAHLAGQVSPARARGGANQGGAGVERPSPPRGYTWTGEGPGARSSGTTLPLPGCAGRAGERPELTSRARRPEWGWGVSRSPSGLSWLGAGAFARLGRGGSVGLGEGGVHTRRNGVRAGEGLLLPAGGGPLQPESEELAPKALLGQRLCESEGQCRGLVLPCLGTTCPRMPDSWAEPLGQEIEGAGMQGAGAEGCFPSRVGVPFSAECARLGWVRGVGPLLGTLEGGGWYRDRPLCVYL